MKLEPSLFSYPVLAQGMDDYVGSKFDARFSISHTTNILRLEIEFILDDKEIEKLIKDGQAQYAIHIEGISSNFRKLELFNGLARNRYVELSSDEVNSNLEVNVMVVAFENIDEYSNDNFNKLYYGKNYSVKNLQRGNIIAFKPTIRLNIDFMNQDMPGYESMFRVSRDNQAKQMHVDPYGDVISINLPAKVYDAYVRLSERNMVWQNTMKIIIVQQALVSVLHELKAGTITDNQAYYDSLLKLLEQNNLFIDELNPIEAAQTLLRNPMIDTFESLFKELEDDYNE